MRTIRTVTVALAVLLVSGLSSLPKQAEAQTNPFRNIPVSAISDLGSFTGRLTIVRFARQGDALFAVADLIGTATERLTGAQTTVARRFMIPVEDVLVSGDCTILDLTLGPIDLNLLGLRIQTNTIRLLITGETGPGNLLGNLLCAILSILDDGNPLGDLAGLLNNILRILG